MPTTARTAETNTLHGLHLHKHTSISSPNNRLESEKNGQTGTKSKLNNLTTDFA